MSITYLRTSRGFEVHRDGNVIALLPTIQVVRDLHPEAREMEAVDILRNAARSVYADDARRPSAQQRTIRQLDAIAGRIYRAIRHLEGE